MRSRTQNSVSCRGSGTLRHALTACADVRSWPGGVGGAGAARRRVRQRQRRQQSDALRPCERPPLRLQQRHRPHHEQRRRRP
eukprot:3477693-Rhodomonas_salina.2